MIPASVIERIKDATNLQDLAAEYGPVKRSGREILTHCPVHSDKDPSCRIWPDHFFCFVCNEGGDPVRWLELVLSISFRESVNLLAERAGIDLSNCNIKPLSLTKINYAREEKVISDWWWARKLEWLHDLGATMLAREDADMTALSDLFKLNMWVRERSTQDAGWPKDAGAKGVSARYAWFSENVKPEERKIHFKAWQRRYTESRQIHSEVLEWVDEYFAYQAEFARINGYSDPDNYCRKYSSALFARAVDSHHWVPCTALYLADMAAPVIADGLAEDSSPARPNWLPAERVTYGPYNPPIAFPVAGITLCLDMDPAGIKAMRKRIEIELAESLESEAA